MPSKKQLMEAGRKDLVDLVLQCGGGNVSEEVWGNVSGLRNSIQGYIQFDFEIALHV